MFRANYCAKLANPARVAKAPAGAAEEQRKGFFANLLQWGLNTVIELPAGWDADLLESNGRGHEVFGVSIDTANFEIEIALAGQVVTVTGGTGFANASIHQTIRADLIKKTADALAYTLNTQGLPAWAFAMGGLDALADCPRVEWDIAPPADREADAKAITAVAGAVSAMRPVLAVAGKDLDLDAMVNRFGIPVTSKPPSVKPEDEPATKPPPAGGDVKNDTDKGSPDGAA
jgi:phage gp29-like protein